MNMRSYIKPLAILVFAASSTLALAHPNSIRRPRPAVPMYFDYLDQSRAKYAAMKTYSDTGTVTVEYGTPGVSGPPSADHYSFSTLYRAPRQFLFDFRADPASGDGRLVIWSDGAEFNTWWSETKTHEVYPLGQGATAFAVTAYPTKNAAMMIAPLLFSQAGLHGSITDLKLLRTDPVETVNGHRCYKLVGEVALAYGTGATTIWIDVETMLVRKILEDTPKDAAAVDRITTTFEPMAEPKIDDSKFKFAPPKAT